MNSYLEDDQSVISLLDRVWDWLAKKNRLLLISHERPDGDAFGSVLALMITLQEQGINACAYFSCNSFPARYQPIFSGLLGNSGIYLGNDIVNISEFDGLVCLDTSNWDRAELPSTDQTAKCDIDLCNIDHHGDNSYFGQINWVDSEYAAVSQMVYCLLRYRQIPVSSVIADLLLVGLITDTGGFRFLNTKAKTLRVAADLIEYGGDLGRIVDILFFNESYNKLRLKTYLLENASFAYGGRFLYTVLEPEIMNKFGLLPADTEDCIDFLRTVAGVDVFCIVQPGGDGVKLSLRSRRLPYNVAEMAHQLGGGGHPLAAGVSLPSMSLDEVLQRLLGVAGKWFAK